MQRLASRTRLATGLYPLYRPWSHFDTTSLLNKSNASAAAVPPVPPSPAAAEVIPIGIGRRPKPNPAEPPPMLVLPDGVKYVARTTPRMTQPQAEEFLYPLYLRGWRLELNKRVRTPFLTSKFVVKDNDAAHQAVLAILDLQLKERHHASFEIFLSKNIEVILRLQTHSARAHPVGKSNETAGNVTLRDVRFAVLFEQLLQKNDWLLDPSLLQKHSTAMQPYWDKVLVWFPVSETAEQAPIQIRSFKHKNNQ